jgi:hypothetical protein
MKMYKIIFVLVLNGCETWSVMIREEYGLKMFENWVLQKKFGPKRDNVVVG